MLTDRKIYNEIQLRAEKKAPDHRYRRFTGILDNMLEVLRGKIYKEIPRAAPDFDDHGEAHADLILALCDEILENNYLQDGGRTEVDVRWRENRISNDKLFVLTAAVLWHDAAMIDGRKDHAINLRKLQFTQMIMSTLNTLDSSLADFYCSVILNIACAHSDDKSLQSCKTVEVADGRFDSETVSVRTKALAGLVRLCDELSDDRSRTNTIAMERVDKVAKIYWLHSRYISLSEIQVSSSRNHPNTVHIVYRIPYEHLFTLYTLADGKDIYLYQFVINRIEKVHVEMTICCPLFADLTFLEKLIVEIFILGDSDNSEELQLETIHLANAISPITRPECWQDLSLSKLIAEYKSLCRKDVEKLAKNKFRKKKKS